MSRPNLDHQPLKLEPGQQAGVEFLLQAQGRAILADDVGYGKSVETIGYMQAAKPRTAIIITSGNNLYKWADDLEKWTDYWPTVFEHGEVPSSISRGRVHIFTWQGFQEDVARLRAMQYDLLIADEAHRAKNSNSQRTQALVHLARSIPHRILLTATPIPNVREELWPLLNIVDPAAWDNVFRFKALYCNDNKEAKSWDVRTLRDLRARQAEAREANYLRLKIAIRPFFLRRLKDMQAPQMIRYPLRNLPNLPEYRKAEKDLVAWLREHGLPTKGAENNPALVKLGHLRRLVGAMKVQAVCEKAADILDADPAKKVVLYGIHKPVIADLKAQMQRLGHQAAVIDGSTSNTQRQAIRDLFIDGDLRVVILSQAGEESLDLYTSQDILFAERPWTADAETQAIGRLHRRGQTSYVRAHVPIIMGTIDHALDNIIERKRVMKRGIVGEQTPEAVTAELLGGLLAHG